MTEYEYLNGTDVFRFESCKEIRGYRESSEFKFHSDPLHAVHVQI